MAERPRQQPQTLSIPIRRNKRGEFQRLEPEPEPRIIENQEQSVPLYLMEDNGDGKVVLMASDRSHFVILKVIEKEVFERKS